MRIAVIGAGYEAGAPAALETKTMESSDAA